MWQRSAKSPDFAVINKQFLNCFINYPIRDRMHKTSKSGDFEEQNVKYKSPWFVPACRHTGLLKP
jgi:hypothetical protein